MSDDSTLDAILDDYRDAIALTRACLDRDEDAAKAISDNCDQVGVLLALSAIAAYALRDAHGCEHHAREWLDGYLARNLPPEGKDQPLK